MKQLSFKHYITSFSLFCAGLRHHIAMLLLRLLWNFLSERCAAVLESTS